MPRRATYQLRWNPKTRAYELHTGDGGPGRPVVSGSRAWLRWLDSATSFSFCGSSGVVCTIRKETVQRGGTYWYAYRRIQNRMVKRYVGRTADLTLARLEEITSALGSGEPSAAALTPVTPRGARRSSDPIRQAPHLLLSTKLAVPRLAGRLVSRPAVFRRLERGRDYPLTLVAAPAGFGKTTALRAWAQESGRQIAWVALDTNDNDPTQFWTYTLTALNITYPDLAGTALAMLQAPHPAPLPAILRTLLNALAAYPRDVLLVLDDYHLITAPAVHESLALLLEHPPTQLHLYLATRGEPDLPLARLRAYGQVNELRAADLRFQPDEVGAFLSGVMGVALPDETIVTLAERSDGWIAGIQIAGLSLQGHPDPARFIASFGGSHRHVLTYLGEEVLAAQPADVQSFLLQTAVLDRMCAPLCDAVTGRADGQAMLERLERANLFLVPLDDEGRWYRYYHLFADLLRHQLERERSHEIATLRRHAARWLEDNGWALEAVEQLFAIPDMDEAARLIEQAGLALLLRGDTATLLRLVERLPEATRTARPRLCLYYADALFARGDLETAEPMVAAAERTLLALTPHASLAILSADVDTPSDLRMLAGEVAWSKATIASMRSDADAALEHGRIALALLPNNDPAMRGGVMLALGSAYSLKGDIRAADDTYAEAARLSFLGGNLVTGTIALSLRALVSLARGRLRQATDLSQQMIRVSESKGGAALALAGAAYNNLGTLTYEQNDLDSAQRLFQTALETGEQWENVEDQIDGLVGLAALHLAHNRTMDAAETFARAEQLVQDNPTMPWVAPQVAGRGARFALQQDHADVAERWAHERDLAPDRYSPRIANYFHEFEYLTYVRLLLARGEAHEAAELLARIGRAAEAEERTGAVIEVRMLQALAFQALGEPSHALDSLSDALALAAPEGYVRTFVDEGAPLRTLLVRLRERLPRGDARRHYAETLLAAFDPTTIPATPAQSRRNGYPLAEPLSEREGEVLHLLAQGRTNQEIARELVVAVSTVKTHLHHLFAKLQAADRLQAVTRARDLGLLNH